MFRWALLCWTILVCLTFGPSVRAADETSAASLFDERIMPIFRSPNPSSCVQCHLAAVDLKSYILPSHEKTFASLRDQGLIDLDAPHKSKILTLIRMGEKDLDEGARLIHEKMRKAEYEAFAAWIKACCDDPALRSLTALPDAERSGPKQPLEVIRHARKSRIVDSFARHVYSQRMRCFPCHTPFEIDPSNPRHQAAIKKQKELEQQFGSERLKIFRETPEATLDYLVERSRSHGDDSSGGSLPMINLKNPLQSLLLQKPLSKLPKKLGEGQFAQPSSVAPVTHIGGLKLHRNDQTYKSWVMWLQDYTKVAADRYVSADELPADNWFASQLVLRLKAAPDSWQVGTPVQLLVHRWDEDASAWNSEAVAFTQGSVTKRRFVNGALFLIGSAGRELSKEGNRLPAGRYLVKCYVDHDGLLADDPTLLLGKDDYVGGVELKKPRWRPGFKRAEVFSAQALSSGVTAGG